MGVLARRPPGELVQVRLADHDRTGLLEQGDRLRRAGRDMVSEDRRPVSRPHSRCVEEVLDEHRNARQRPGHAGLRPPDRLLPAIGEQRVERFQLRECLGVLAHDLVRAERAPFTRAAISAALRRRSSLTPTGYAAVARCASRYSSTLSIGSTSPNSGDEVVLRAVVESERRG